MSASQQMLLAGGLAQPFASISGNLTSALYLTTISGYSLSNGAGSMNPTAFGNGTSVTDWSETGIAALVIAGFLVDPGQNGYFTTATYNGTAKSAASATGYSYSSGVATWSWNTIFNFATSNGISRAFSIT